MYVLQAFIAHETTLRRAAPADAVVVPLAQGMAMLPLSERLCQARKLAALHPVDRKVVTLPQSLADFATPFATLGKLAYVEAEIWGELAVQACIIWDQTPDAPRLLVHKHAINTALRALGVQKRGFKDEFEALGLGLHETPDDWESLARQQPGA